MRPPHIVILGLGGVGGYFGGLWTRYAMEHPDQLRVSYLMRPGAHYDCVRSEGLRISSPRLAETVVRPSCVTCDPQELGPIDYLVVVTKSYDLADSIRPLQPFLTKESAVLPLLNGLDIHEQLRTMLPAEVERWAGIAYVTARRTEPGVVESHSDNERLYAGSLARPIGSERTASEERLLRISQVAGIDLVIPDDPMEEVRKKFLMLSNSAAATGYYDCGVEGLLGAHRAFVIGLTEELCQLYRAKGWGISDADPVASALRRIERMPPATTTSMNSDLRNHHQSEVESLVGYVVRESQRLGLSAPHYEEAYAGILQRIAQQ